MFTRLQVEKFRLDQQVKTIDVFVDEQPPLPQLINAVACTLRGGKLYNCCTGRVVCGQLEPRLWGYIKWRGNGDADKCNFEGTVATPFRRHGQRVDVVVTPYICH